MSRNSLTKTPDSNPVTPPTLPKGRKLRIGPVEIQGMARLLSQRLNEAEACGVLGIAPRSWWRWKQKARNNGKFAALLAALTGSKIDAHLQNIDLKSSKDWRASAYILSATDPSRFSTSGGAPQVQVSAQPTIPPQVIAKWVAVAYDNQREEPPAPLAAEVVDTWSEARQLAENTTATKPEPTEPLGPSPTKKCPPMFLSKLP